MNYGYHVGTNGFIPLFVPRNGRLAGPFFQEKHTENKDYRTALLFDSPESACVEYM